MAFYILREKDIDQFGENVDVWKPISYTENHDTAIKWQRDSQMLLHKDFITLPRADDV